MKKIWICVALAFVLGTTGSLFHDFVIKSKHQAASLKTSVAVKTDE